MTTRFYVYKLKKLVLDKLTNESFAKKNFQKNFCEYLILYSFKSIFFYNEKSKFTSRTWTLDLIMCTIQIFYMSTVSKICIWHYEFRKKLWRFQRVELC